MKRCFCFIIMSLFLIVGYAELDDVGKAYVWNTYKYWEARKLSKEEIIKKVIADPERTKLTEQIIMEVVSKGEKEKWDIQDIEQTRINFAMSIGRKAPAEGMKVIDEAIEMITKNSPDRKAVLADAFFTKGALAVLAGDHKESEFCLTKAIELDDINKYRALRAGERYTIGDEKGCNEDLEILAKRAPTDPYYLKYKEKVARWRAAKAAKDNK